jgi:hypothetical protein
MPRHTPTALLTPAFEYTHPIPSPARRPLPYDTVHGTGTFFASAFDRFLQDVLLPDLQGNASRCFVVFPDFGAHRRFCQMVMRACGIKEEQVLWIPKSRVGADIQQVRARLACGCLPKPLHSALAKRDVA